MCSSNAVDDWTAAEVLGDERMTDSWDRDPRERSSRRRGQQQQRRRERRAELAERVQERTAKRRRSKRRELTPEEEAYREARRRADRKLGFIRHLVTYAFVIVFLMLVTRSAFVAGIVGLSWGIGLSLHFFQAIMAPELRSRWIQTEVRREVVRTTTRQRRELSGEKTRSLEELSASIAHEIRNPITAAKSLVQQMGEDPQSTENVEYAQVALQELDRVEKSISHLLRYAREEDMRTRSIELSEVMASALEAVRDRVEKAGVEVIPQVDHEGEMDGDPEQLRRVFINLLGNAVEALQEAGTAEPRIELGVGESLAGTEVWATIRDNGPGLPAEAQDRIFTPFYTSKEEGTGLGLAITRKLVEAHGGSIELNSEVGQGTEFVLLFPKSQQGRRAES
jgi:signal transduction histidine kinase